MTQPIFQQGLWRWLMRTLLMTVATLAAYAPALQGRFLWDDSLWITDGPAQALLRDASGLGKMWGSLGALQQYFPLTGTSFWLDHQCWGVWTLPYHVENVLLHVGAALLFWRLLERLQVPGAWLAAWVFVLHPVMVESVGWITERKNVLCAPLFLAALLAYVNALNADEENNGRSRWRWLAASWILFAGALLAKSAVIMFPVLVLLILWWRRGTLQWRRDLLPLLPFFTLALADGLLTMWMEKHRVGASGVDWELPAGARLLVAGRALWFYAAKLAWPTDIAAVYPKWHPVVTEPMQWLFPVTVLVVFAVLWLLRHRLGRAPLAACLVFAAAVFPLLGFFNVYGMLYSYVADRWVYLPSLALVALSAAGAAKFTAWLRRPFLLPMMGAVLLPVLAFLTWKSSARFANESALWRATIAVNPDAWLPYYNLGIALAAEGRSEEALTSYEAAIKLNPNDDANTYLNLGNLLLSTGHPHAAIPHFLKVLEIDPSLATAHNSLGLALFQDGQTAEAFAHYRKALELLPDCVEALLNLGNGLLQTGKPDEAIEAYQRASKIDPEVPDTALDLGAAFMMKGRLEDAIANFQQALRLKPDYVDALKNLSSALTQKGQTAELRGVLQRAQTLVPGEPVTLQQLAWLLATAPDDSLRNGPRALRLAQRRAAMPDGNNPITLHILAAAYAEAGQFPAALETAQKAHGLAMEKNQQALADVISEECHLYEKSRPRRDTRFQQPAGPK